MSYIVVRVYSFECDKCGMIYDVTPRPDRPTLLQTAHRELRNNGWAIDRRRNGWHHVCPKHFIA